jgi:hypothetical protein
VNGDSLLRGILSVDIPNLTSGVGNSKNWVVLRHDTFHGANGFNFPLPECGILMTNQSSQFTFPWIMYMGVVKDIASTSISTLRMDFGSGTAIDNGQNSLETASLNPSMSIRANGNVGIGTTNPSYQLSVKDNIQVFNATNDVMGLFSGSYGNYVNVGAFNQSGGAPKNLVINHLGGNVGIGTTNPSEKLDVMGNARITGNLSVGGKYISPNSMFRNRIINGDMRIDQRNVGATVVNANLTNNGNTYLVDRFSIYKQPAFTISVGQATISDLENFRYSLRVTNSSAVASPTELIEVSQRIEGYDIADLGFGKQNTNFITLSFWVKSSIIGTYSLTMRNFPVITRSIVIHYQILNANTWEFNSITVPVDLTGSWSSTYAAGVELYFNLVAVSLFRTSTLNTWLAGDFKFITGTTYANWIGTAGATWELTGLQFEKGPVATPFEFRPFGIELQMCMRYFQKSFDYAIVPQHGVGQGHQIHVAAGAEPQAVIRLSPPMRFAPIVTLYNPYNSAATSGQWSGVSNITLANARYFGTSTERILVDNGDTMVGTGGYYEIAWAAQSEL